MTPTVERVSLPFALRRPAGVAIFLAVSMFLILAVRYSDGSAPGRFDSRVISALNSEGVSHKGLQVLVMFGDELTVGTMMALLAGLALVLGRPRLAVLAIVGPLTTGLVTTFVKPLAGRVIDGDSLSFPSGHTGGACALGLVTALLVINLARLGTRAAAVALMLGALIPGAVMGIALIVNGWHYPTDTIGGLCAAVTMVLTSALVIERIAEQPSRTAT